MYTMSDLDRNLSGCYTRAGVSGQLRLAFGSEENWSCLLVKPDNVGGRQLARDRQ